MATASTGKKPVAIRWKDYIPTPKRHRVYLWLGSLIMVGYISYLIWESYQTPESFPDRINNLYNTVVYLLIGLVLLLRGLRVHFLRHTWFVEMDDRAIRYRMVLWTRARKLFWADVVKIRVAFEEVSFYLKNGKTHRVNLDNVPDEEKIEETKQAIIRFGRSHSIPVTH